MTKLPLITRRILDRVCCETSGILLTLLDQLVNGNPIRISSTARDTAKQRKALNSQMGRQYAEAIRNFHRDHDILTAGPKELLQFAADMFNRFGPAGKNPDIETINEGQIKPLFNYTNYRNGKVLSLAKGKKRLFSWKQATERSVIDVLLQHYHKTVRFCPYCNAAPIYYHDNANGPQKRKPPCDHFFPQSVFPFLALSLYNLIPACDRCNRIKLDQFSLKKPIAYPHLDDLHQLVAFRPSITSISDLYGNDEEKDSFSIAIVPTNNDRATGRGRQLVEELEMESFYRANFRTEAKDVMIKTAQFTRAYQEYIQRTCSLKDIFDAQRLLFGTPLRPESIHNHFLAKMILDIQQFCESSRIIPLRIHSSKNTIPEIPNA